MFGEVPITWVWTHVSLGAGDPVRFGAKCSERRVDFGSIYAFEREICITFEMRLLAPPEMVGVP